MFARRVLPEFLNLLAERVARNTAAIDGRTITALLESVVATAGIVATPPDAGGEDWGDAASLTTELYDRLLATRLARFGPTPNRVPHRGYAPAELRTVAESLLAAHTNGGREGGEA